MTPEPLLRVADVSLSFGELKALNGFELQVGEAEIHGLIGPNGAGKTTAINVMTGFLTPTAGRIVFRTATMRPQPHRNATAGIARTFQSPSIFPGLTPIDNVLAGKYSGSRAGILDGMLKTRRSREEDKAGRAAAREWLRRVGYAGTEDAAVSSLPFGELRKIELARALISQPKLLFLDEPTAGLTAAEVQTIGTLLHVLREKHGFSVVLVEHNVPFVFSTCSSVTAMQAGRTIATGTAQEVRSDRSVIETYLGSAAATSSKATAASLAPDLKESQAEALKVTGLDAGYGALDVVRNASMTVKQGELVLLCGRNGGGKTTLLNAIAGAPKATTGVIELDGQRLDPLGISGRIRAGLGLVPQERGVIASQDVESNLKLASIGLRVSKAEFADRFDRILQRFPRLQERRRQIAGTLSGGERQMLAIAKVLIRQPKVLLLDEPTIGLGPAIIEELAGIIGQINREGMSMLVAEQSIAWVAPLAHRAIILERGAVVAVGAPEEIIGSGRLISNYLGGDAGDTAAVTTTTEGEANGRF